MGPRPHYRNSGKGVAIRFLIFQRNADGISVNFKPHKMFSWRLKLVPRRQHFVYALNTSLYLLRRFDAIVSTSAVDLVGRGGGKKWRTQEQIALKLMTETVLAISSERFNLLNVQTLRDKLCTF